MKFQSLLLGVVLCFGFAQPTYAAKIGLDDLMPPAQADTPAQQEQLLQVKNQDKVSISKTSGIDGKPVVEAASEQDAVNAALKNIPLEDSSIQIKFPSGFGWVTQGIAMYEALENPTATLIAQRNAYVIAYLNAKKALAESLYGLTSEGKDSLKERMDNLTTAQKNFTNSSTSLTESLEERVSGMLRGYVVYNVKDEPVANSTTSRTVTVSIVTTNKTISAVKRPDANSVSVDSVQEGINHVLAELNNKIAPPIGGTVILVPQTNEMAFIGYGTDIVRTNTNPTVQKKNLLNAVKIAKMRARSALVGIINGDSIEGSSKVYEGTDFDHKEFVQVEKNDPLNKNNEKETRALEQAETTFKNTQSFSEAISSLRKGVVPPGVTVKSFTNDENTIVTAIALYLPSMTKTARDTGKAMKEAKDSNSDFSKGTGTNRTIQGNPPATSSGASNPVDFGVVPGTTIPQGLSGNVTDDKNL